tara:strand:+ start:998 stop:1420 length:423 start_codon:yes stop_codon:yes gene_type:complete
MSKINLKYTGKDLLFDVKNESNYSITLGQTDNNTIKSARPMDLLLMALASCSSVDIVKILQTQKQELTDYRVEVDAKRQENRVPSLFETITLKFIFEGDLSPLKVERAVSLSIEKYCSVSKIIEQTATINYELVLNGKTL